MLNINKLPVIKLEQVGEDVSSILSNNTVQFKNMSEAPWFIKKLSSFCNDLYLGYKGIIYVPIGHLDVAMSKNPQDRVVASSKLIPWAYAIKNGSVSSITDLLYMLFNTKVRSYYFMFEYALLKSHDIPEVPELVATGFLSTRRNWFGLKKNPDKVLKVMKEVLASKIDRAS